MSEWRDMKSAPRDGTKILVWAIREGWERYGPNMVVAKAMWPHRDKWGVTSPCDRGPGDGAHLDSCIPLMWMKLPEPPAQEKADE